jgi:MinD-like ATPase involved in chromosome partitioning or flagellar assembly
MRERYVLLGLARPRADWFRRVGQWATSAVIPAEFVRCVSAEELRARLASSRPFSALLVDADLPVLDRDLVAQAAERGCAVLVVGGAPDRDWRGLGAAGVLPQEFGREELLESLAAHAQLVGGAAVEDAVSGAEVATAAQGRLIAVTGPGGTGASTAAIALAQGLARGDAALAVDRRAGAKGAKPEAAPRPSVLLADLARVADQAMLHDSRVVVPGLQEIVDAHRTSVPSSDHLRDQTFDVPARGYRLLLGLRRPRHWVAIRPRALEATLDSLQRLCDVMVADVDPDVEGEAETGSVDVEERNLLTRATLARADAVVVVGEPSMKGLYALVRLIGELLSFGVPGDRLVPVLNRASRNPRVRAELTSSFSDLLGATAGVGAGTLPAPTHLPERRIDEALRDGVAVPKPLPQTLARAVAAVVDRAGVRATPRASQTPERVAPGSLSTFTAQERPRP